MAQQRPDGFEDVVRGIVGEAVRFAEQASRRDPLDPRVPSSPARATGIDVDRARGWADELGRRLAGEAATARGGDRPADADVAPAGTSAPEVEPAAEPHPRDLPSEAQGRALAALDSGRWALDAAGQRLRGTGVGPAPARPKRLVRELRARDWLGEEGRPSRAGARALERWLDDGR